MSPWRVSRSGSPGIIQKEDLMSRTAVTLYIAGVFSAGEVPLAAQSSMALKVFPLSQR